MKQAKENIPEIVQRLEALYGKPEWHPRLPILEELIQCILSQHTSDSNSWRAYEALREAYPSWQDVIAAPTDQLAEVIRGGGLANQKAPRIQAVLRTVQERSPTFDMRFLEAMDTYDARKYLLSLPGIGPKCAAIVLCFAMGRSVIPVDTHVFRVAWRLGLIEKADGEAKAHDLLQNQVPEEIIYSFHVCLIRHGRSLCKAPVPRCQSCPLTDLCRYYYENQLQTNGDGGVGGVRSPAPDKK
jgi:endonuclease-3